MFTAVFESLSCSNKGGPSVFFPLRMVKRFRDVSVPQSRLFCALDLRNAVFVSTRHQEEAMRLESNAMIKYIFYNHAKVSLKQQRTFKKIEARLV